MRLWGVLFAGGLLCAPCMGLAEIADPSISAGEGSPAIYRIKGEVLIRAELNEVLIAVDEADEEGRVDGWLDHLFVFKTLEPVLPVFTLRDTWAEIEARPRSVEVAANTERREFVYAMHKAPRLPRVLHESHELQINTWGIDLYRYSGPYLNSLSLDDIASYGAEIVRITQQKSELLEPDSGTELEDYLRDPSVGPGSSSCTSSCNIVCVTGSCTSSCNYGRCAKCSCIAGATAPSCTCN